MKFNFIPFNQKFLIPAVAVLVLALAGGGYYFWTQYQKGQAGAVNPQEMAAEEVKKLVEEVGKIIDLPTGEDPTVATITDITKLSDQPFFAKGKNGDKVLIYTNARRAILYDPNLKKVLDVAPINIGTAAAQAAQSAVILRNGTTSVGLTTRVETELKKSITNLNVVAKENASRDDFAKTVVVLLNERGKDLAETIAKTLNAEMEELPSGESKPNEGDVLVILGKDRI